MILKPFIFSETPIPKAKHSGIGKLNYPTACCGISYLWLYFFFLPVDYPSRLLYKFAAV